MHHDESGVTLDRRPNASVREATTIGRVLFPYASADPSKVFPGVAGAGLECSQWYGLTLCCVALASYLASRTTAPDVRDGVSPVVGGMLAYHLGISGFQIRRLAAVATGAGGGAGAGVIAAGALGVHAPLAALFALAAVYCFGRR